MYKNFVDLINRIYKSCKDYDLLLLFSELRNSEKIRILKPANNPTTQITTVKSNYLDSNDVKYFYKYILNQIVIFYCSLFIHFRQKKESNDFQTDSSFVFFINECYDLYEVQYFIYLFSISYENDKHEKHEKDKSNYTNILIKNINKVI